MNEIAFSAFPVVRRLVVTLAFLFGYCVLTGGADRLPIISF